MPTPIPIAFIPSLLNLLIFLIILFLSDNEKSPSVIIYYNSGDLDFLKLWRLSAILIDEAKSVFFIFLVHK